VAEILLVDDQKSIRTTLKITLKRVGYQVEEASCGEEALRLLEKKTYDLVITDLKMEKIDGIKVLQKVKEISQQTEVIVITAYGTVDSAVQAMKIGAYDYIAKPFEPEEIVLVVNKALERKTLTERVKLLEEQVRERYKFENIVGNSPKMLDILKLVTQVCQTDSTVLILGESGTGKELIAQTIHNNSPRKDKPFVIVNCSALPEGLQDSEFFGHIKGAFTGAIKNRKGLFEEAHQGTIFLDEIGEISPAIQVKLLRFLQSGEIRRIGDNKSFHVDVRLIAATNKDLQQAIQEKTFREDLFYRLNVIPIKLPALRERKDDIPLLVNHFLERYRNKMHKPIRSISQEAVDLLVKYDWPGNVRELENVIERAVALATGEIIVPENLPRHIQGLEQTFPSIPSKPSGKLVSLAENEKNYILEVLQQCGGNKKKTAQILQISKSTLWRKLKEYGLQER
jgi:DNA-binding NtrC family response regulator